MNELQIFNNEEFGEVRTVEIDGEPWFVASDIAKALNYRMASDMTRRLDEEDKGTHKVSTLGGEQEMTVINESGLYSAILGSNLSTAKRFKRWVTSEVLPTIRKTGGYQMPQTYAEALRALADKAEQAERLMIENEEMKPKAEFFDAVTDSKDAIPMADVAKVLDKLFIFLRNNGVLQADNRPYQRYIDNGWFRTVEQKYDKGYGETGINIKTLVFQKGVDGIRKLLLKEGC